MEKSKILTFKKGRGEKNKGGMVMGPSKNRRSWELKIFRISFPEKRKMGITRKRNSHEGKDSHGAGVGNWGTKIQRETLKER